MKEHDRDSFFWELLNSFNPLYYRKIADRSMRLSFRNMLLGLGIAFLVLLIVLTPFFVQLPTMLHQEVAKFDELTIDGNLSMTEPIELPKQNTQFVFDTTGEVTKLTNEKVIITKDYIYFKQFTKTKRINVDKLLDIQSYRNDFVWMMIGFLALIIPSLLFYGFVVYLLKYLLIMFLFSILFYVTERFLLLFKVSYVRVINVLMFAIFPMAVLEIAFLGINTDYLIPAFSVYGVTFYVVSTLVYLLLATFAVVIVEKKMTLFKKDD